MAYGPVPATTRLLDDARTIFSRVPERDANASLPRALADVVGYYAYMLMAASNAAIGGPGEDAGSSM